MIIKLLRILWRIFFIFWVALFLWFMGIYAVKIAWGLVWLVAHDVTLEVIEDRFGLERSRPRRNTKTTEI